MPTFEYTEDQLRDNAANRILCFAREHGLTGEEVVAIFEAGMTAAQRLRPDLAEKMKPSEG